MTAPAGSKAAREDRTAFRFWVEDLSNGQRTYKDTIFNFAMHREPQHYKMIVERKGAVVSK